MPNISNERIKEIMKQRGLTQVELLRRSKLHQQELGITLSRGALSQYLSNKSTPDKYKLLLLARTLNVSMDWLLGYGKDDITIEPQRIEPEEDDLLIFVNSVISAGTGIIDFDAENFSEITYAKSVPPHDLAFRVEGDSMQPLFRDDEIVFIERAVDFRDGQVIAIQIDDNTYLKKAYKENGHLKLISLNPEYEEIKVNRDSNVILIGVAIV